MGVLSHLVVVPLDSSDEVFASDSPAENWDGFSFKGMDNVKLATLLSLLSCNSASNDFDKWLDSIPAVGEVKEAGPWLFLFQAPAVDLLATIPYRAESELIDLMKIWGATEEFEGWQEEEIGDLLRNVGALAETANLQEKGLFLWMSL